MYEVYALIASLLLPTGLMGFLYFLYHIKYSSHRVLWTLIFENIATILLGIFYLYSAVILSQTFVSNDPDWLVNNIDDLAIVNGTISEPDAESFYPATAAEEHNNEIEDTRNSKAQNTSNDFVRAYQALIWESAKKWKENGTRGGRGLFRNILNYARELKDTTTDILENHDCFLRVFLYQGLLVYSFITSAISLINTCLICNQCTELTSAEIPKTPEGPKQSENGTETIGEKIVDDCDKISQVPVGPLFQTGSCEGSSTNLEVFSVKKLSQVNLTNQPPEATVQTLRQENPLITAVKCVTVLVLPVVLVLILYVLMKNNVAMNKVEPDNFDVSFLPNFNDTTSNMQADIIFKDVSAQSAAESEITHILKNVYKVINSAQENQKNTKMPIVTGQYLSKLKTHHSSNVDNKECIGNESNLKTFDFAIFVLAFFAVLFYTKTSEMKLSIPGSKTKINKCIWAFSMMWSPGIIDLIVSRMITTREPNVISALLLLLGNMDRLYSTKRNIDIYKMYGKANTFVNPISKS